MGNRKLLQFPEHSEASTILHENFEKWELGIQHFLSSSTEIVVTKNWKANEQNQAKIVNSVTHEDWKTLAATIL